MKPWNDKRRYNKQVYYRWDHVNCRMQARVYRILRDSDGNATCAILNVFESKILQPDPWKNGRPMMYRVGQSSFYGISFADELNRVFDAAYLNG